MRGSRRQVIEFASIVIFMTVLGAVGRSALPQVNQLIRFVLIVLVTVAVWLAVRAVLRRFEQP
jgi:Na+/H+-dicarboxylate symporter